MRIEVSCLALVPGTFTMVPSSQSSAHVPLHSEAGEPVTQPRPRRRDSGLRSLQGLGSGGGPELRAWCLLDSHPSHPACFPAPVPRVLATTQRFFGPQDARHKRAGRPRPLSPLASSAFWAGWGRGRGGCLPSPTSGGGGAQSRARAEGNLDSFWPQGSKSAPGAAAATAAARAAWGGERASPTPRSAGDLNATETVIHHGRSR